MNDRHQGAKFVIFTLIAFVFAAWLIAVIGNVSVGGRESYSAEFTDVSGLLVNDQVKVAGVGVGKVNSIEIQPGGTALVNFEVDNTIPMTENTRVEVRWRDVIALRFLYLVPAEGPEVEPGHRYGDDQTSSPADVNNLLQRLTPVMSALDPALANQVLEAFQEALVDRVSEVRTIIDDGAQLVQALASRDDELRSLLTNAAEVVGAYASRQDDLRSLIDTFAQVSTTIAGRNDVLESALVEIANVQEETSRLLEENDAPIRASLDELEVIANVLSVNHANLDNIVETLGRGLVTYHRVSRIGQWFNINAMGVSFGEQTLITARGAELTVSARSTNLAPFFLRTGAPAIEGAH